MPQFQLGCPVVAKALSETKETGGATYVTATGQASSDDQLSCHQIQVCCCNCLLPVISIDKREGEKAFDT